MKAKDLPFPYAEEENIFAVERIQKLFLSACCLLRDLPKEVKEELIRSVALLLLLASHHVLQSQPEIRQSLGPFSSPSSIVCIHLPITEKVQKDF